MGCLILLLSLSGGMALAQLQPYTLRLTLSHTTYSDQAIVGFRSFGLDGRDGYDADKLDGTYLNVSTLPDSGLDLVGNVMAPLTHPDTIPVRAGTRFTGDHTLSFEGVSTFDSGTSLYLRDLKVDSLVDLNLDSSYTYTVTSDSSTQGRMRFQLLAMPLIIVGLKSASKPGLALWPNPLGKGEALQVQLSNMGKCTTASLTLLDPLGRVVYSKEEAVSTGRLRTSLALKGVEAGVYLLRVQSGALVVTREVILR